MMMLLRRKSFQSQISSGKLSKFILSTALICFGFRIVPGKVKSPKNGISQAFKGK
jgi:hypothetical protein